MLERQTLKPIIKAITEAITSLIPIFRFCLEAIIIMIPTMKAIGLTKSRNSIICPIKSDIKKISSAIINSIVF